MIIGKNDSLASYSSWGYQSWGYSLSRL